MVAMVKYLKPYKLWSGPAVGSILYTYALILISAHHRMKAIIRYFDSNEYFFLNSANPFAPMENFDSYVFKGFPIIYWGGEIIWLFVFFHPKSQSVGLKETLAATCQFLTAGLLVFFLVMNWCMIAVAGHHGYHLIPQTLVYYAFLKTYEMFILIMAAILAFTGMLLQFNRQAGTTFLITLVLLWFHKKYLW